MTPILRDPKIQELIDRFAVDVVEVVRGELLATVRTNLGLESPKARPRRALSPRPRRLSLPAAAKPKALPAISPDTTGKVVAFLVGRKDPIGVKELSEKLDMAETTLRVALRHLIKDGVVTPKQDASTGRKILYATT
jgi:hypothetical protein